MDVAGGGRWGGGAGAGGGGGSRCGGVCGMSFFLRGRGDGGALGGGGDVVWAYGAGG